MKKLMLFAMWLAASGAAVATAWAGVSVVDGQVAPPSVIGLDRGDGALDRGDSVLAIDRPDGDDSASSSSLDGGPSTLATNRAGLSVGDSGSTSADGSTVAGTTATASGSRTSTTQVPATNSSGNTSSSSSSNNSSNNTSGTSAPSTGVTQATSSTTPSTTSTTKATTSTTPSTTSTTKATTSTTQSTTSTTQGATTKTFNLVGGSTAVSFSSSGVQILWATAKPGFDVKIENEGSGMKVEFESDDHRSRIDVWWSGGPQHQIREEAD